MKSTNQSLMPSMVVRPPLPLMNFMRNSSIKSSPSLRRAISHPYLPLLILPTHDPSPTPTPIVTHPSHRNPTTVPRSQTQQAKTLPVPSLVVVNGAILEVMFFPSVPFFANIIPTSPHSLLPLGSPAHRLRGNHVLHNPKLMSPPPAPPTHSGSSTVVPPIMSPLISITWIPRHPTMAQMIS